MNIATYLKQPFPKAENKWRNIILITFFVTLFLVVFQPFGLGSIAIESGKYLFIGGFGVVSFVILVVDLIIIENIFPRFFKEKNWRLYKEIVWLFCVVFTIGLGNVLYVISFSAQHLSLAYIAKFQLTTFAVALFPISILTISKHNYLLKQHAALAETVNSSMKSESTVNYENKSICLCSYNEKVKEEFDINTFYYLESKGNDIELNLYENNRIIKKSLRNTLKKSLEYFSDSPDLVQCHRAYIVNLNKVDAVEGNSQGLILKLTNCDAEVPVSRSFVKSIKNTLSDLKL